MKLIFSRWHYIPSSDNLDFSWSEFFWIVIPLATFFLLWHVVIDKWLKKWEDRKEDKN